MQSDTQPTTHLDRFRRDLPVLHTAVMGIILSLGLLINGPATASILDPGPPCAGYTVGLPDGCWERPDNSETAVKGIRISRSNVPANVR